MEFALDRVCLLLAWSPSTCASSHFTALSTSRPSHKRELCAAQLMLLIARTLRLSCLAFRTGGGSPSSTLLLLRPAHPHPLQRSLVARPSSLSIPIHSSSCCSTRRLSMSSDDSTGGGGGGRGVIQPRVPVSSITAFGQGLGQEELQVRTDRNMCTLL